MIVSKTWYGHHIETIKGEDYVLFKNYLELDKEIEKLTAESTEWESKCYQLQDIIDADKEQLNNLVNSCQEEIRRLKAREQECIDKYVSMSKYASEMEGKYIIEKYIVDELEKDINSQLTMTRELDKYNEGFFDATLHYYNKLKELKEIRPKEESK